MAKMQKRRQKPDLLCGGEKNQKERRERKMDIFCSGGPEVRQKICQIEDDLSLVFKNKVIYDSQGYQFYHGTKIVGPLFIFQRSL